MTENLITTIHAAEASGLVRLTDTLGRTFELAGLEHRIREGSIALNGLDVEAFRRQIDEHQAGIAKDRRRDAAEAERRGPSRADVPETSAEAFDRERLARVNAIAARRDTDEGRHEQIVELLAEIRDRLPERGR